MTDVRPQQLTITEAGADVTQHVTRVVLGIGLLLVIAAFAQLLFITR